MSHNAIFLATGNAIMLLRDVKLTNGQYLISISTIKLQLTLMSLFYKTEEKLVMPTGITKYHDTTENEKELMPYLIEYILILVLIDT